MKTFLLKRVSNILRNLYGQTNLPRTFSPEFLTVFHSVSIKETEEKRKQKVLFLVGNIEKIETMARKVWKTAKCQNETRYSRSNHDQPVK